MAIVIGAGASGRNGREGRAILSLRTARPNSVCSSLEGAEQADHTGELNALQRFEQVLWAERNAWDIERRKLPEDADAWLRGGGFAGRGKLSKSQAARLLTLGFEAVGRKTNALADYAARHARGSDND